ncbi:MAG: M28 family peptidase [Acidobacteriota bacterium]|nr:M28 family peptidase [Acidobacteriota bacterium]MDD8027922.1 M28 family peptidase [Acidobacteriota bacterium]
MIRAKTAFFLLAAAALAAALPACRTETPAPRPITPAEIEAHIRFLSDDLLEGRALGGRGIEIAALYQEQVFRGLGLEPAFPDGSYRQTFEARECAPDPKPALSVKAGSVNVSLEPLEEFVVNSYREDAPFRVSGELVYAGYGIQAPERDWDDLKGMDLAGKVLLVEINEPGNVPGGLFDGEAMTYYGRWVYKYEKAAELGAAGCLIIHDTKGAAYGWDVVRNGWSNEEYFLPDKPQPLFFRGWISAGAAERICAAAGRDRRALRAAAETRDFVPVPLEATAEVRQRCRYRSVSASNVAGLLRGSVRGPGERFIVFSAHYDHLGVDPTREGDRIFNGAVDNGSASAAMLALARLCAEAPERPRATLVFAAVTGEENQFLGSDYFVRHLPFPAEAVLADLNFEMTGVWGETEDVYAIGASHSDLDEIVSRAAARIGLRYTPERDTELGYFFRSDQFSFARNGLPAAWLHEGIVSRTRGAEYLPEKTAAYKKNGYHQVGDEIQPDWDFAGTIQIALWAREIAALLDASPDLPQFKPESSFKRKQPH